MPAIEAILRNYPCGRRSFGGMLVVELSVMIALISAATVRICSSVTLSGSNNRVERRNDFERSNIICLLN